MKINPIYHILHNLKISKVTILLHIRNNKNNSVNSRICTSIIFFSSPSLYLFFYNVLILPFSSASLGIPTIACRTHGWVQLDIKFLLPWNYFMAYLLLCKPARFITSISASELCFIWRQVNTRGCTWLVIIVKSVFSAGLHDDKGHHNEWLCQVRVLSAVLS